MIFEFDPTKYRFAVEIGIPGKLERLDKIPRPRPNETIACAININVFDWVGGSDGYGEIEQDGVQYKPESKGFPSISFKDGKLTLGDLPGAQVGVGIPITLVIDGKIDIRNPSKLATGFTSRTAVGQKSNGNIVFVTQEYMTTSELAEYMKSLGCINAFQGDSGGSTGMYLNGKLYDQGRAIAAALVAYKKKLIAIDDGHGMETAGKRTPIFPGTNTFMHENEFNNAVAQLLKINLEKSGFDTLMVAPDNFDTPLKTRTDRANAAKADFYISIHANALTGEWGTQNGISTYHYSGSVEGKKAAEIIHRNMLQGTKLQDKKVQTANFHVLKYTKMTSVLCECAFMDNLAEAKLLLTGAYRQECADEICRGICEYYGVEVPKPSTTVGLIEYALSKGYITNEAYWLKKVLLDKDLIDLFTNIKKKG